MSQNVNVTSSRKSLSLTNKPEVGNQENNLKVPLIDKDSPLKFFTDLFDCNNVSGGQSSDLYKNRFGNNVGLLKELNVVQIQGLNPEDKQDFAQRAKDFGTNAQKEGEEHSFLSFVLECLEDRTLQILLAAAAVSLIIGILQEGLATGWIEGTAIFMAVFIVVSITAFNNWSKENQFRALNKEMHKKTVLVRRNGKKSELSVYDLLVGDLVEIKIGDILNVDGVLIEGDLEMDESAATGESNPIKKTTEIIYKDDGKKQTNPFVLSGTQAIGGEGVLIVCAVGENTFSGQIKSKLQNDQEGEESKTPLEKQLQELASRIESIGFIMAIFIGALMVLKELLLRMIAGDPVFTTHFLDTIVNAFIIAVTVLVVAIPEGLPMAVTISLAYSVKKMKEENNLVRHLDASETMGNCNNICTDKTGTLTQGNMSVSQVFIADNLSDTSGFAKLPENVKNILSENLTSNITSSWDDKLKKVAGNNMTENALLKFVINSGFNYKNSSETANFRLPFDSKWKFMISLWKNNNSYRLNIKGAPDRILEYCQTYYAKDGKILKLTKEVKEIFVRHQDNFASQAERTLISGYTDLSAEIVENALKNNPEKDLKFYEELLKNDITLLCLFGIADLPKPDVAQAILKCKGAGLTVRMVTGDFIDTAIAIARKVNILTQSEEKAAKDYKKILEEHQGTHLSISEGLKGAHENILARLVKNNQESKLLESPYALEGNDFEKKSGGYIKVEHKTDDGKVEIQYKLANKDDFARTVKNLYVIGRASPNHKFLLVLGLKELNNVVAVTGDGTNDAPALKLSHVGFSMGIRGTDIAKDASDIVLLDDSFSSVVTAIKFGRNVYDCIRKFLQFQLTTNIVAVFMTLLGGIILKDSPLNAIQMLWVNLIMDSFASLALATEPPSDKLLERAPYAKDNNIITKMMMINIISQAIFQIIVLTIIIFYGDIIFGVPSDRELSHFQWNNVNGYHFTIFFNIFVYMQVFNSINARKLRKSDRNVFDGIFNNSLYLIVQLGIVFGQIFLITFGGRAVRVQPLSVSQHLGCAAFAIVSLIISLLIKLIPFKDDEVKVAVDGKKEIGSDKFAGAFTSRLNRNRSKSVMGVSRKA